VGFQTIEEWRTGVSKSLMLCIVLMLCVACMPGEPAGFGPAVDLPGQLGKPIGGLRVAGGLVADQASLYLLTMPGTELAGMETTGPAGGWVPDGGGTLKLIGFKASLLPQLEPNELVNLMTWLHRGIWFEGDWSVRGLRTALHGLHLTLSALGGNLDTMSAALGISPRDSLIYRVCADCFATGAHFSQPQQHRVTFDSNPDLTSFLHETGHVVDYNLARGLQSRSTWWSEVGFLGLGWKKQVHQSGEAGVYYVDTDHDAPHSEYSPKEDFADTFAAWVLEENYEPLPRGWRNPSYRRVLMLATVPTALLE
jgi:hypothetical protein